MARGSPLTPEQLLALQLRRILATRKRAQRKTAKKVPVQRFPRGVQVQYLAGLKRMQGVTERAVRDAVYPNLDRIATGPADYITRTVDDVRFAIGENINTADIDALASKVGQQLNLFNKKEIGKQLKSVVGVDLIMAEPWLEDHIFTFRRENVNLIKSLHGQQLDDIENLLLRANRQGLSVNVIRKQIQDRFKVSKSKAQLIARDQVGKLNGEITQLRQTSLGVENYTWRNSQDERVRGNPNGRYPRAKPSHWAREGKKFSWDDPPEGGHPGEAVLCRCRAEPDLSPLLEAPPEVQAPEAAVPAAPPTSRPRPAPAPTPPAVPGRLESKPWTKGVSKEQVEAFGAWKDENTFSELRKIQAGKKKGSKKNQKRLVEIEKALETAPLYKGNVYRGLQDLKPDVAAKIAEAGSVMEMDAITSFTSSPKIAEEFLYAKSNTQWVRLKAPVTKAKAYDTRELLRSKKVSKFAKGVAANEREVLMAKGEKLRVKSSKPVTKKGRVVGYEVELEEI